MPTFKDFVEDETKLKPLLKEMKNRLDELEKEGNISDGMRYPAFSKEDFPQKREHILEPPTFISLNRKTEISFPSPHILGRKLELLKSLETLQTFFNDLAERHIQYFRFKEKLKELRDIIDPAQWDLLRLIVGCRDAVTNIEPEELNLSHIEAFRQAIEKIDEDIDCSAVNSLLDILISKGLKPIPPLKSLESIED